MKKRILIGLSVMTMCQVVFAGGFKIGLQGLKQNGMGHTGIGFAQDAATIYFNPGGMPFTQSQINGGLNLLMPSISFLDHATNTLTNATNQVFTPFSVYGSAKLASRLHMGIGVYTPFGSGVMYPTDWSGRYILSKINLQVVNIQPTIAYKVTDEIGIGIGYIFSNGKVQLEKDLPLLSGSDEQIAHATLDGKAHGAGFNAGIYYQPDSKTSFGITYHSKIVMKVEDGNATFDNIPAALASSFPAKNKFTSELTLPSELGIGYAYQVTPKLKAAFDFNYTFWKSYDSLGFNYEKNSATLTDAKSPRLYENAMAFRIGLQGEISPSIIARVGAFYDQTPVPDGYVAPELPDNNKLGLTAGASFTLHKNFYIDFSCLYENVFKRTQVNKESGLNGTFQTKVIAPGIGFTYMFNRPASSTPSSKF